MINKRETVREGGREVERKRNRIIDVWKPIVELQQL